MNEEQASYLLKSETVVLTVEWLSVGWCPSDWYSPGECSTGGGRILASCPFVDVDVFLV